eukprot:2632195-Prymnesium_polylepis.2
MTSRSVFRLSSCPTAVRSRSDPKRLLAAFAVACECASLHVLDNRTAFITSWHLSRLVRFPRGCPVG